MENFASQQFFNLRNGFFEEAKLCNLNQEELRKVVGGQSNVWSSFTKAFDLITVFAILGIFYCSWKLREIEKNDPSCMEELIVRFHREKPKMIKYYQDNRKFALITTPISATLKGLCMYMYAKN